MKYAKLPKKYKKMDWRPINIHKHGSLFGRIVYPYKIFKPICLLFGHKKRWIYLWGFKVKYCERCCEEFKRIPIEGESYTKLLGSGEIGELSAVRFIESKKIKIKKQKSWFERILRKFLR